jgi:surface antigen
LVKKTDNNRVNVKARIDRHLRIVKDNIWTNKTPTAKKDSYQNYHLHIVLFFIVFIFPLYPTLASFVYNNSSYEFYRWDIDTSSIIESYDLWMDWVWASTDENVPMLESADSFLSVNTILNDERDLTWTNEIINYEVRAWDSFSSIAYEFKVSTSSILWANNFSTSHVLRPWEVLKVPPVSWLIHQVKSWDTLSSIAEKYDIEETKIKSQNLLSNTNNLKIWDVLVIPWAVKKVIKTPVYKAPTKTYTSTTTSSTWYSFAKYASSEYTTNKWSYKLVRRKPYSWVAWNCTWYVASYKNVDWRWNANQWLRNAAAKWHATWKTPKVWSIVQLTGTWYNPRYWHVAIVMEVLDDYLIVSDMNYRKLYEVTYRKIPINDRTIDWYIYID